MNIPILSDIEDAAGRLEGIIRETPLFESTELNEEVGGRVFNKYNYCDTQ